MANKKPGYILHADPKWIDFHLENSVGNRVGYCRGPKAPMKILAPGGKLIFIRSREKEKRVYFWADFDSDEVVAANLAWKIYGSTIGAANQLDCQNLLDRLPFVQLHSNLRVIGGRNMFAPIEPISLSTVGVEVKKYATKGWSISADELELIIKQSPKIIKETPSITYASASLRKVVEEEAVSVVRNRYELDGWQVVSVETENVGYDLLCKKDNEELHIEVKGTSTEKQQFILTRNEYGQLSSDPKFVLCLVTDVLNSQEVSVFSSQQVVDLFNLDPLSYQARRKTESS